MNTFEFILVSYGLTQILALGRVFRAIRPKHYLFTCPMCVGFWVGMLVSLLFYPGKGMDTLLTDMFFYGCLSSGTSFAITQVFGEDGFNLIIWPSSEILKARQKKKEDSS